MEKKKRLGLNISLLLLAIVLFTALYTFVLQKGYSKSALDAAVNRNINCAEAIHRLVSDKFTKEDFENITSREDMQTERYKELQQELNELRSLNSTRYLYTATRDDDGKVIYLVDGLDLDADDFAYPGTYVEDEVVPYIEDALDGKTTYSQNILDTTWGHIFTACFPVWDSENPEEVIGALCMEMDMEDTYAFLEKNQNMNIRIAYVAVLVLFLMAIATYFFIRRYSLKERRQQELLKKTAEAAEAANKAKSTFLFNMSHDIRTPMNAILGYTELADRNLEDYDKTKTYHEKIRICGQRMLAILDNVLELARIENGKVTIEESANKAGKVLDDCLLMVKSEADKKHLNLIVKKEIRYPYIYFDPARISEIILNLLSNAIKYTGEGGEIHCIVSQSENSVKGWVNQELLIKDNGIGMSEEFQEHIYETFARERTSTVSGIEGSGLGMGIVKNIVELMGGTIELTSKLGEGSAFKVCVPCRIASYEETQPKRAETDADTNHLSGKKILLAEDNDLNAEIAMELLSEEGLIIERVKNGVECVEKIEKMPVDYYSLILMDIQMPVLDGYTATEKIRKLNNPVKAAIPIIAMTANAFAEDKKKALEVGMNDHVAKPIDMNILIEILEKYV